MLGGGATSLVRRARARRFAAPSPSLTPPLPPFPFLPPPGGGSSALSALSLFVGAPFRGALGGPRTGCKPDRAGGRGGRGAAEAPPLPPCFCLLRDSLCSRTADEVRTRRQGGWRGGGGAPSAVLGRFWGFCFFPRTKRPKVPTVLISRQVRSALRYPPYEVGMKRQGTHRTR